MNKRIKIILFFFSVIFITCDLFSQKGYQLGFVQYNSNTNNHSSYNLFLTNGIEGGITYDIKLKYLIYLHTAGLLSVTYNSLNSLNYSGSGDIRYNFRTNSLVNDISIPLQLKFILPQTPNFDAFVFTGPTMKGCFARFEQSINTDLNETNYLVYVDEPFINRFTVYYGIGIGFKYRHIYIQGTYDWGIINPYKDFNSESFNITIGKVL